MIDWSKSHCGVMLCDVDRTIELMPEVSSILNDLKWTGDPFWDDKLIDVKVHMLMPGQFPCIPNFHRDFMPRDEDNKRTDADPDPEPMFMWLSGPPLTEYIGEDGKVFTKPAGEWHTFYQKDVHRGTVATEHTWRCFIRVIPARFVHDVTCNVGTVRRHSQVYLDSQNFTW